MRGLALPLIATLIAGVVTLTAQDPLAPAAPLPTPTERADALWAGGLFDEAEALYASELARDPASPRARFGVARTLAMQSRLEDALAELSAAVSGAPDDPALRALQGEINERLFRYADAAAAFEASLMLTPGRAVNAAAIQSRVKLLRSFGERQPARIEPDPDGTFTVPFSLVGKKIVMKARVNGTAVEFVLDTGSERTTITNQTASRAGIRSLGETLVSGVGTSGLVRLGIGSAERIEIGPLRIRNVGVSIRQVGRFGPGVRPWQHEIFSPVALGLSTVVDYQRRRVTFSRRLVDNDADVRLPLRVYRLPLVRGVLNTSVPAYFVVDTGGELISISADTASELKMTPARHIPLRVFGVTGLDEEAFLLPGVDVAFAGIEYRNFGLAVLNLRTPSALLGFRVGGIVGHRFLGGHRVAIDLVRSELRLTAQ